MMHTFLFSLALSCLISFSYAHEPTTLSAKISLAQETPSGLFHEKLQAVFPIKIALLARNQSCSSSQPGKIFVRYAFPRPNEQVKNSVLFTTEMISLPPIAPGEEVEINFKTPQPLPTISEFVCNDWAMRQFQAVLLQDDGEEIIGTLALTYSAYYYPLQAND